MGLSKNERLKIMKKTETSEKNQNHFSESIELADHLLSDDAFLQENQEFNSAKAILFTAMEQLGLKTERLMLIQRKLRELFSIITAQYDSPRHDKAAGQRLVEELKRYADSF